MNKYVAAIKQLLPKLKIFINSALPTERNISGKQNKEDNVIEI